MSQMYVDGEQLVPGKGYVTDQQIKHHYAKGSAQREGLLSTVQKVKSKGAVNVPIVVGGKEVSTSAPHSLAL